MFEDNLREARKVKGLTQKEVAKYLGVSQSAVAQYELGAGAPNIKVAVKLAQLLDTTCEELVNGRRRNDKCNGD